MAKKAFEIQGSDLNLGGVTLQAGATTIVIPGVTQATNYRVEEVNETDVEQTFSNFPAESEVVVIDKALYDTIVAEGNESTFADFTATTDDDGEIDEIEVNGQGTYSASNADRASLNDMYAYIGTNAGNTFTQADLSDPSRFYFVQSGGFFSLVSFQDAWTNSADHTLLLAQPVPTVFTVIMGSNQSITYTFITSSSNEIGFDGTWLPQPPSTTMETPLSISFGIKSASDRPLVPQDWIQIPFRPKMRAGEISNTGGGSGGVVERSIEFPQGESGDTSGTLALIPNGDLYICKTDWTDVDDVNKTFDGEAVRDFAAYQSGFDYNFIELLVADHPGLETILNTLNAAGVNYQTDFTVNGGGDFGGAQTISQIGFSNNGTEISIGWPHRTGVDPTTIDQGDEFIVIYTGTVPQPAIWELLNTGNPLGDLTIEFGNEITNGDGDILIVADDDIRLDATDEISIRTSGTANGNYVEIITGYDSDGDQHQWKFDTSGNLTLPEGGDIVDSNGDSVLGGANSDPNIWVQTFVSDTPLTDFPQMATSVEYDADGNVIALFSHYDTGGVEDSRYFSVGKYTPTGTKLWTVRFAAELFTDGWGLAVDSVDNWIYIAGSTDAIIGDTYPVSTLTKIDGSTGSIEWSKVYDFGFESSSAVVDVDSAGHPIMVGYADDVNGDGYLTITKVDKTNGNVTWTRKLDGQTNEQAYGMAVGPNDEIVAVGYMDQFGVTDAAATLYTDPASNVNWTTGANISGAGISCDVTFTDGVPTFTNIVDNVGNRTVDDIIATISGVSFGGTSPADDMIIKVATIGTDGDDRMVVVKYLDNGSIAWQKAIQFDAGWNCNGADADIDSAGNVYICGQYNLVDGPGGTGMALVKFNSSGVKQWSRRVTGDCISTATSIVVGPDDKLYISGVNGDEIAETFTWVVAKYDFDGLVEWQRFVENSTVSTFGGQFFNGEGGGSNIAVRQGYVALAGGFADLSVMEYQTYATVVQVPTTGNVFTVGNWDFKASNLSGTLNSSASDITVVNARLTDSDNVSAISPDSVTLGTEVGDFLVGTLFTAPGSSSNELVNGEHVFALESDGTLTLDGEPFNGNGFAILADGTLQANVEGNTTTLTSTLTSKPTWLTITPRSPDRNTLDTHYGFDSTGMWFTGNNEETFDNSPAYPIHTTDSFPADVKVVVEFEIDYNDGEEDWGICVYPADGVPHWSWDSHPSRIAATIDIGENDLQIYGFTESTFRSLGNPDPGTYTARFTYDPIAELTTFEIEDVDGVVFSRCQQPGRLARDQDYRIGFDADWDNAGVGEKSYFTGLTITSGNTTDAKPTELTVTGEIKLPSTVKGFVNIQGPWDNSDNDIHFQTVVAHNGFAYMGGETSWNEDDTVRLDKYSLATGELVWTRVLGAGRNAEFSISWTGGAYNIDSIMNSGEGYETGELLYIAGFQLGGDGFLNRATITVTGVDNSGSIQTATIAGTAPDGSGSSENVSEYNNDGHSDPISIKYDTVSDTVVMLNQQFTIAGDIDDLYHDRAVIVRINPVSGDVVSTVTLSDEGDIRPYDVAIHPTTGVTAVVGEKFNEYRQFGTLTMAVKADGYFDILKSELDPEHYPGSDTPGDYYQDFWISGTGITGKENVDNVNYYDNLATTVRQGSGTVTFDIDGAGAGAYTLVAFNAAGSTNYLAGHKLKVLGSLLGGVDDVNDAILTVDAVGAGGVIEGFSGTVEGLAVIEEGNGFTEVSGTNYNVGSGFTLNIQVDSVTGSRIANVNLGGSNYVANDVAYISGSEFANGSDGWEILSATTSGYNGAEAYFSKSTYPILDTTLLAVTVGAIAKFDNGATARVNVIRDAGDGNWGVTFIGGIPSSISGPISFFANDVEVTIVSIGEAGGNVTSAVTAGSTPTNMIRIYVNGVDFTVVDGAWTMKQDLEGEAFVWTPTWNKAIGGASNDRFRSVVYSKDGASIYAVGEGRYEVDYDQSLVVKYATSDGTIEFSKYLNSGTTNSRAFSVATIGTSDIVVSGYEYMGPTSRYTQFVARMTSSGTVVWKKLLINTWPEDIDNRNDIQVDSDDNIYVTMSYQADTPGFTSNGFHVTKLDQAGNVVWSRCVNAPSTSSSLGYGNGNRWSSLHNDQLVVAGYTYNTGDDYANGLWASFPTDGFTYLGGEGDFVQMGAFRFSQGSIYVTETLIPGASSFTPSVQAPTITATDNLKKYETRDPIDFFEQHLHKMVDPKHGGLVFGDGSRQTFATDKIPQIKADNNYTITAQDSGKHIYYKNNSGTIIIPSPFEGLNLPVGFTFTIINRSGGDCYVQLRSYSPRGTILGAGRNSSFHTWGIPDSGSGSMVTLILLETGQDLGDGDTTEPIWMISGPGDIYPDTP